MKTLCQILSWVAIAGTILPSFLFLMDSMNLDQAKLLMRWATILWFVVTPLWMGRGKIASGQ